MEMLRDEEKEPEIYDGYGFWSELRLIQACYTVGATQIAYVLRDAGTAICDYPSAAIRDQTYACFLTIKGLRSLQAAP